MDGRIVTRGRSRNGRTTMTRRYGIIFRGVWRQQLAAQSRIQSLDGRRREGAGVGHDLLPMPRTFRADERSAIRR